MNRLALVLGMAASALVGAPAWALPSLYDGFDYANGSPLAGQEGGYGWSGPWVEVGSGEGDDFTSSQDGTSLTLPGLPFTPVGNHAVATGPGGTSNNNFVRRSMASSFSLAEDQTLYASVLLHKVGAADGSVNNFEFNLNNGASQVLRMGSTSGNLLFLGVSGNTSNVGFTLGETYLMVLKVDANVDAANQYSVSLFDSSSTIPGAEPATYDLTYEANSNATVNTIQFAIGNRATGLFDEVRIGKTWADVTSANPNYILGDFDQSGAIQANDYQTLAANLYTGTTYEQGDIDFSGRVDLTDFAIFRDIYTAAGFVLPPGAPGVAVPEPATWLALAGAAVVAPLWLRRRKAS